MLGVHPRPSVSPPATTSALLAPPDRGALPTPPPPCPFRRYRVVSGGINDGEGPEMQCLQGLGAAGLAFGTGDTVGIVVDTDSGVGYCVRNGATVFQVSPPPLHPTPSGKQGGP